MCLENLPFFQMPHLGIEIKNLPLLGFQYLNVAFAPVGMIILFEI